MADMKMSMENADDKMRMKKFQIRKKVQFKLITNNGQKMLERVAQMSTVQSPVILS